MSLIVYCAPCYARSLLKKDKAPHPAFIIQTNLGDTVRLCRKRLGLTQEELAWQADMHRTYIADIERGGRNLTLRVLAQLAAALRVSVGFLLARAEGAEIPFDSPVAQAPQTEPGELLLIEDNAADAELAVRSLNSVRVLNRVAVVGDGSEALDFVYGRGAYKARAGKSNPLLIILDLNLPTVPGVDVLRQLKADPRSKDIPVVVLSGSHDEREIAQCARLGAENYILKPLTFDSLRKVTLRLQFGWALLAAGRAGAGEVRTAAVGRKSRRRPK